MNEGAYTVEVREMGHRMSLDSIADPFIRTTVSPRGWRVVWAVLLRRYEVQVMVNADPKTCEAVLRLDPDYSANRTKETP